MVHYLPLMVDRYFVSFKRRPKNKTKRKAYEKLKIRFSLNSAYCSLFDTDILVSEWTGKYNVSHITRKPVLGAL